MSMSEKINMQQWEEWDDNEMIEINKVVYVRVSWWWDGNEMAMRVMWDDKEERGSGESESERTMMTKWQWEWRDMTKRKDAVVRMRGQWWWDGNVMTKRWQQLEWEDDDDKMAEWQGIKETVVRVRRPYETGVRRARTNSTNTIIIMVNLSCLDAAAWCNRGGAFPSTQNEALLCWTNCWSIIAKQDLSHTRRVCLTGS